MDADSIAYRLEAAVHAAIQKRPYWKLYAFTPSVVSGRRYVGVEVDGKTFSIEINVEQV